MPTRVSILREQLPLLAKRDWIAGAILWCYQDYKSRRYFWPGQEQGYLEHGIVDENRQRKPSYFAWARAECAGAHRCALDEERRAVNPRRLRSRMKPRTPARRLPSIRLSDYRVSWQLVDCRQQGVRGRRRRS